MSSNEAHSLSSSTACPLLAIIVVTGPGVGFVSLKALVS
jgi:hypothetical protein